MKSGRTRRRISILGSTGSIGLSALDVVRHYREQFEVVALGAHSNAGKLAVQIREFAPRYVALADERAAADLRTMNLGVEVLCGPEGIEALAAVEVDTVLCAMVGAAGLRPVLSAIDAGNTVALANKEPMVMAGKAIMERAARGKTRVLPVDSEHNAIFQCIHGHELGNVRSVHLTASGGPFYGRSRDSLANVTPEEATKHPTWVMGAKVSVDSATLMNKGLEIIEAMWLFGLKAEQIEVVIHPQSVVHGLVEFNDGHMLAHLGVTDMRFPILFALTYPDRVESPMERLDLGSLGGLTFARPDFSVFPCLGLAREAALRGGSAPAIMNAANEEAVAAFCCYQIPFLAIGEVVEQVMNRQPAGTADDLPAVLAADSEARAKARECISRMRIAN